MHDLVLFAVVAVLSLLFASLVYIAVLTFNAWQRKRANEKLWTKIDEQLYKPYKDWFAKLEQFKHLLTGEDWRDAAGKEEFVRELFGEAVPKYLWYWTGDNLTNEDVKAITGLFWPGGLKRFTDFEFHGRKIRIRNAEKFLPEIKLPGRSKPFPLCQVGHSNFFGGQETGCVNFVTFKPELDKVS